MKQFFAAETSGDPFVLFSTPHKLVLISLLAIAAGIIVFRKHLRNELPNKCVRYALIGLILTAEISLNIWRVYNGIWNIQEGLPLHLCGISMILSIFMLALKEYRLFEITYFWGLIGALIAMITPELKVTYNHFKFWQFFGGHAFIIFAVVFMAAVEGFRPRWKSIGRTFVITNLYMLFIAVVNAITGGNYLYIARKPEAATPLDFLGPWPWYILTMEVLALVLFALYCLPYGIKDVISSRKRSKISLRG